MTGVALSLLLLSACLHATWNLLAKRTGSGAAFVWLFALASVIIYAPVALLAFSLHAGPLRIGHVALMVVSGLIHLAYFLLLQRGYRVGDLSLVYPLARGTGPALSTLAAIAFLGERPTPLALCGAALVCGGVFLFARGGKDRPISVTAVVYGLSTGLLIAAYTLWDSRLVGPLAISPLMLDWVANTTRALCLAPVAVCRWADVRAVWRAHRAEVLGVAVLSPLAYMLVLAALAVAPVSHVAPLREVSILVGTFLGSRFLAEPDAPRRLFAAATVVAGVIGIAIG